jgi:tripartite-type tricarboxylate transporter receptor subunit TctC
MVRSIPKPLLGLCAVIGLSCAAPSAHADEVAAFYRGKTIQMRVGSAPGGSYDLIARALVRYMGKYLPGHPNFVVQNVPGAGSVTLANQLYNVAPRDGTVIGIVTNGAPTAPLLTPNLAHYDPGRFSWIGSPGPETQVALVWHTVPIQSMADLYKKEVLVGGVAAGTATVDMPLVMNAFAGTKFKLVSGYQSTVHINLAMERGEVQGQAALGWNSLKSTNPDWITGKKVRILAQYGFKKNPELPDVPLFPLPKDAIGRQAVTLMVSRQDYGRPFLAPPGVPADRVKALRTAFDATMKDAGFLQEAKALHVDIDPLTGADLDELTMRLTSTTPQAIDKLRAILGNWSK